MDTRFRLREFRKFVRALRDDYKSSDEATKKKKKRAILKTVRLTFDQVWSGISAPLVYPIWYTLRKQITNAVYEGTTWQAVHRLINDNRINDAKLVVQRKGRLLYWLWTYGDLRDPLGRGELPEDGYRGRFRNNFVGRFYENALRNPRFTINYMNYRTGNIAAVIDVSDTRDHTTSLSSEGIGSAPVGTYFKWFVDSNGEWYYIYDDNNRENLFYFGYTGLGKGDPIGKSGRFEIGYRRNNARS